MSKSPLFKHPVSLNLVFLLCLAGSILFGVASEIRIQKNASCQALTSSEPAAPHSKHPPATG